MQRSLAAVLILGVIASAARAGAGEDRLVVQATVPARVILEPVEVPARLLLSETDVARGYKDVAASYVVRQNAGRGWLLRFSPRLGLTRHVEIRGLSQPLALHAESVEVFHPRATGPRRLALDFRFVLGPDARPGSYELPVHLSATPL